MAGKAARARPGRGPAADDCATCNAREAAACRVSKKQGYKLVLDGVERTMDAVVGMRDLLAAANRQKEDAFVNGLEAVIQAQKAQEARIAAQDEQIAFLKAQSNDGV